MNACGKYYHKEQSKGVRDIYGKEFTEKIRTWEKGIK